MWRHSASVSTLGHFVVGNILGGIAGPNLVRGPRQPRRDGKEGYLAMIAKIEIERFSLTSSRPFDEVLAAIKGAVGNPDMVNFAKTTLAARTFMELDHGVVIRKATGRDTPRIVRLIIGNPLIMKEMAKRVPDAGSYAPVTVLVDERPDGVHISYDRMASLLAPYGNSEALAVARDLDEKVEALLYEAAG